MEKTATVVAELSVLFVLHLFLALLLFSPARVGALNIGVQAVSVNISVGRSAKEQCSRKCESQHCNLPPFLRYGKYCGILYSGCPGETPCDALDSCCMAHDACVLGNGNDYLSQACNESFLTCIESVKESGRGTFKGNQCSVQEVWTSSPWSSKPPCWQEGSSTSTDG